jgi:hypothetical protein
LISFMMRSLCLSRVSRRFLVRVLPVPGTFIMTDLRDHVRWPGLFEVGLKGHVVVGKQYGACHYTLTLNQYPIIRPTLFSTRVSTSGCGNYSWSVHIDKYPCCASRDA